MAEVFERCPCGQYAIEVSPPTQNLGIGWRWFKLTVLRHPFPEEAGRKCFGPPHHACNHTLDEIRALAIASATETKESRA